MKKSFNFRLVPIYILIVLLFAVIGAGTAVVLALCGAKLSAILLYIFVLALVCVGFAIAILYFFGKIKKNYDNSFEKILSAFSTDKTEALLGINDGNPDPEQISKWVCEQTETSRKANSYLSIMSAEKELANEILWQLSEDYSAVSFGSYWSHTYGYIDLGKSNNIRNFLSSDTLVNFDKALKSLKENNSKNFSITGDLKLRPQKQIKIVIKGTLITAFDDKPMAVGTIHDIQEELMLTRRIQAGKIREQFLLAGEQNVIYEVNVPENRLTCLNPAAAKEMLGMGSMFDFEGERRPYWDRIHPDYRESFIDRFFDYNHMLIMPEHKMSFEYQVQNRLGDYIWVQHQAQVTETRHGMVVGVIGRISNINELKSTEMRNRYQSVSDSLTGAYVRSAMETEFNKSMDNKHQRAVVVFNINRFRLINNEYGYEFGNMVLKYFVTVLWDRQMGACCVGRLDNDTFAIAMFSAGESYKVPDGQIKYVLEAFAEPISIDGKLINLTVSAGGSQISGKLHFEEMCGQAEEALSLCKKQNDSFENAYIMYGEEKIHKQ